MDSSKLLLFIDPKLPSTKKPVIDKAVFKMTGAMREAWLSNRGVGVILFDPKGIAQWFPRFGATIRSCSACCGLGHDFVVQACDFEIIGGYYVNPLGLHILAYHREEIPPEQIRIIRSLPCHWVEPRPYDFLGGAGRRPIKP